MSDAELQIAPGTTLRVVSQSDELLLVEARYAPLGLPPPAHLHPRQDEHFEVLEGSMKLAVDGDESDRSAGDAFDVPRGTPHQMWNPGADPALIRWSTTPAGRTLEWFRELAALLAGTASEDPATVLLRFEDVFRLAEP